MHGRSHTFGVLIIALGYVVIASFLSNHDSCSDTPMVVEAVLTISFVSMLLHKGWTGWE